MYEINSYKDLDVWKKSMDMVKEIYENTKDFPSEERFGLMSQMRRAAVSIPSNIAEGFRRGHTKECPQFLRISLGSCGELETQAILAKRLGFIKEENEKYFLESINHISAMLTNLIKKL